MNQPVILTRILERLFQPVNPGLQPPAPHTSHPAQFAVTETDLNFFPGGLSGYYTDRNNWDRYKVLSECLKAWRINPLARRYVKMTTQFVCGKEGLTYKTDHRATQAFLDEWYKHPLNQIRKNSKRWMDELTRSGNLFFLISVDSAGMTYVRAVPAEQISDIQTAENDVEQEKYYLRSALDDSPWPAYDPNDRQDLFMIHFALNQPVGTPWGEPDLAPLLPWMGRYLNWLEDRARLNRFRNAFLFVLKKAWRDPAQKQAKLNELMSNPPPPGSWLLLDQDETLEVPSPRLESSDAAQDGLAIKKLLAIGEGVPLHYMGEPESSTRTTAEAAGTPTFRSLEDVQSDFKDILSTIATIAVQVRKRFDRRVSTTTTITVSGPDITEKDNANLALAVNRLYTNLADMFDRELIESSELLRLFYRMIGETQPEGPTPEGIRRQPEPLKTAPEEDKDPSEPDDEEPTNSGRGPAFTFNMPEPPAQHLTVNLPASPTPDVHVTVEPPDVTVHLDAPQPTPNDQPPTVIVQVNPTPVTIKNEVKPAAVTVRNDVKVPTITETHVVERDSAGRATKIKKTAKQE